MSAEPHSCDCPSPSVPKGRLSALLRPLQALGVTLLFLLPTVLHAQVPPQIRIQGGGLVILNGGNLIINGNRFFSGGQPLITPSAPVSVHGPRLLWANGETLPGQLLSAADSTLTWSSPLFAEPLVLSSASLRRIDFPPIAAKASPEPFSILFRNGDLMHADIVSLTDDTLTLRRIGQPDMAVPMAQIQTIRRHIGLPYQGPSGLAGWQSHLTHRLADWSNGERGTLTTHTWNRAIALPVDLPQSVLIEFTITASKRPQFSLGFSKAEDESPKIETWEDELVVTDALAFKPLRTLQATDRSVALRLTWDRTSHIFTLHDQSGKSLASITAKRPIRQPAIVLRNKGSDLTLAHLSIRPWNGQPLPQLDAKAPRIDFLGGRALNATLRGLAAGCEAVPTDGSTPIALAWDQLAAFDAGPASTPQPPPLNPPPPATRLAFADGSTLTGDLVNITNGLATVRTPIATEPLTAPIAGLTRITLQEPAAPDAAPDLSLAQLDELTLGGTTLHGTLAGTGEATFRWLAPGATQPVALASPTPPDTTITRAIPSASQPSTLNPQPPSPALFFLRDGSIVPGELTRITPEGAGMKSPITALDHIAATALSAIHFRPTATQADGFDDTAWQVINGSETEAQLSPEKLILSGAGSIGHPSILFGNQLSFDLSMPSFWGAIAVQLFVGDLQEKQPATQVHFLFSSEDFWCAIEDPEGGSRTSEQLRGLTQKTVRVRLQFSDSQMQIFANDLPLITAPLDSAKRKGTGLAFAPSTMWGNNQARIVEITNFSVRTQADFLQLPSINPQAREQALLIPRFRRDTPPTHVLLAPNGDLLRGRIEGATAKSLKFVSGVETISVPTERIAAAVWLKPAVEEKVKSEAAAAAPPAPAIPPAQPENENTEFHPTHWLTLKDGAQLALAVQKFDPDTIIATSPTLGLCRIPLPSVSILRIAAPPPSSATLAYQDWQLHYAPEPVLPETGGEASPLLGKAAPDFTLPLAGGGQFQLAAEKGTIIVLDFWATWCGPCVAAMPEQIKTLAQFAGQPVKFIAINQGEPEAPILKFLQQRHWALTVALDQQQEVGKKYGVEGIPHTVIIGPTGNIEYSITGAAPGNAEQMAAVIRKLLGLKTASAF